MKLTKLTPNARMLRLGTVQILFSYEEAAAYKENGSPWVRMPEALCTKTTHNHLVTVGADFGVQAVDAADFDARLELVLRRARVSTP